jgi:hypothetical protein
MLTPLLILLGQRRASNEGAPRLSRSRKIVLLLIWLSIVAAVMLALIRWR